MYCSELLKKMKNVTCGDVSSGQRIYNSNDNGINNQI